MYIHLLLILAIGTWYKVHFSATNYRNLTEAGNHSHVHNSAPPFVTFIVPSKGRDTLNRTIASLRSQIDTQWSASIVFDGLEESLWMTTSLFWKDERIRSYNTPKIGQHNFGGVLRNIGMSKARGDWLAFVDDDDVLSSEYLVRLKEEVRMNPLLDAVIFRMSREDGTIFPPPDHRIFSVGRVGISFAIARKLFEEGLRFQPSKNEDFEMLQTLYEMRKRMVMSPYVTYFVRDAHPSTNVTFPRYYLN